MNKISKLRISGHLVLTIISAVSAVLSVIAMFMTNSIASEANRIAKESQLPDISVRYLFQHHDIYDNYRHPCQRNENIYWDVEFATGFDITNSGGRAVSLVDVRIDDDGVVETFHDLINARMNYEFFGSTDAFEDWLKSKSAPYDWGINQSKEKIDVSGPPINIDTGETHRIVLLAREQDVIDKKLAPDELLGMMKQIEWYVNVELIFGDGSSKKISVPIVQPYESYVGSTTNLKDFPFCQ